MKKETKNRNQKRGKKIETFSPGWCFQPGLKILPRGGPWPGLEAPFTPGWCFQPGLKVPPLVPGVKPGLKEGTFSPGLVLPVGKLGRKGFPNREQKALLHQCIYIFRGA